MRARDLTGFGSKPGAAVEEPGAAVEEPGAAAEEPGAADEAPSGAEAAEDDATETELAACICFGLWRRSAIVKTSTRPHNAVRFPHERENVVVYL